MTTGAAVELVSVADVVAGLLPAAATGVRWQQTDWVECREHLLHPSWSLLVTPSSVRDGVVLTGHVDCDACSDVSSDT